MAYYSTHGISQFLLNNEKQRVRFLLAHPVQRLFSSSSVFIIQMLSCASRAAHFLQYIRKCFSYCFQSINADIGHTTLWCCEYSDVVMTVKKCKSGESSINWKSARTDFTTLTCARRSYMYSNITCVGKVSRKTISRKANAQSPADTERLAVPHVGRCCRCRANDGLQLVTDVRWVCWLHSRLLNTHHCRSAAASTSSLSSS